MSKLTIIRGLPASGKDTFARAMVADTINDDKPFWLVNRDALRFMAGLGSEPTNYEKVITAQQHTLIRQGLRKDAHVISSDMNLDSKYVKALAEIADHFGAEVDVVNMDTPLETCIRRDILRARKGGHTVGEDFIVRTHKRFFSQGKFPANPLINRPDPVTLEPYVRDESLPTAYIFDIDGTKAGMTDRSPYDYTKVSTDFPHEDVLELERILFDAGHAIINLSGREDSCYDDTVEWINRHGHVTVPVAPLFMRKTGDKRADFIIKYEIFKRDIAPYFNVLGVFDDRDQVVNMWRSIGVRAYQVAPGNF